MYMHIYKLGRYSRNESHLSVRSHFRKFMTFYSTVVLIAVSVTQNFCLGKYFGSFYFNLKDDEYTFNYKALGVTISFEKRRTDYSS